MNGRTVVLAALVAYGWWFTTLQPFSLPALFAMLGAAAVLLVVATNHRDAVAGGARDRHTVEAPAFVPSAVSWSIAVFALSAWELLALFSHPRSQHPTISSLLETAQMHHPLRMVVYVLWLALGWVVAS